MKKIIKFLKPYKLSVFLVFLLLIFQTVANLYLPDINAQIINEGVVNGDIRYILKKGGFMLFFSVVVLLLSVGATYFSAKTSMSLGRDLRKEIFRKVSGFSQAEIDKFGTPSLITRTTNDVQQVQQVTMMVLSIMASAPLMCVGGVIMALRQDVPLSLSIVVIVPILALVAGVLMTKTMPLFKIMQKKIDRLNQVVREKLSGVRVIRAFVRTEFEEKRYDEANRDLTKTALKVNRMMAVLFPSITLVMYLSSVAIIWFGGKRIDSGGMPIGNLTAFLTYIMQILMSVMMSAMMFIMLPRAAASAQRINEVLETDATVPDSGRTPVKSERGTGISFENVTFKYPEAEEAVLSGLNFNVPVGTTTAIIGSTGSGKSTLVNLIPRFFDVTEGSIKVNGLDIREMSQRDLRNKIGFVPQKAFLFSGTIASNLRYGREEATEQELWDALQTAQAKDFVEALDDKLESPITQGGTNVSGGQRQRLAIARALVKKPEIYIFDDSFSALDFKTDANLREALKGETKDAAVLIVAQRISTILNADQIIVLDNGKIAGIGRHKELLENCEVYKEIVYSQLSEEEIS